MIRREREDLFQKWETIRIRKKMQKIELKKELENEQRKNKDMEQAFSELQQSTVTSEGSTIAQLQTQKTEIQKVEICRVTVPNFHKIQI